MKRFLPLILAAAALAPLCPAQVNSNDAVKHPAAEVVVRYLRHALSLEYDLAAKLIEPQSLESLKGGYIDRIKAAPVLDEEMAMIKKLGGERLSDIEAMTPAQFYIAYNKGLQSRFEITPELLNRIKSSIKLRVLSVGLEEDGNLAHVLVRTEHDRERHHVKDLELVSLVKVSGEWKVSLVQQRAVFERREDPGAEKPVARAEPVKPTPAPRAEPVEPTGKEVRPAQVVDPVKPRPVVDPVKPIKEVKDR
ncbi:MAG: hypothetical protein R3F11_14060 [Verrucomicrobiales bacterium]